MTNHPLSSFIASCQPVLLLAAAHQRGLAAQAHQRSVDAQRYPQLRLSAFIGEAPLSAGEQSSVSSLWSIGPSLTPPLFGGGARRAEIEESLERMAATRDRQREAESLTAHDSLLTAQADHAQAWFRLYRSLGFSWNANPNPTNQLDAQP